MLKGPDNKKVEKVINVGTGAVKVGRAGATLRSTAIGSCIVIAAYDSSRRIGALAHVMLPGRAPEKTVEKRTRYAADAIDELIDRIARTGAKGCDIEVCLVGGGNVLKEKDDTVCRDNIESTTQLLEEKQIPIRAAVLGGAKRRGIFLDVERGKVFYTEGEGKKKLLWEKVKGYEE
jgi:chemotaxis protein CheD